MKWKLFMVVVSAALLSGCQGREVERPSSSLSSSSVPSSSVRQLHSSVPVIESVELPPESESESSQRPVEVVDPYPAPILTDTEKALLEGCLQLFIQHLGEGALLSAQELDPDRVLALCLESIYRGQAMTAQILEEDDEGNVLIPENIVIQEAQKLLGLTDFQNTGSSLYDAGKEAYVYDAAEVEQAMAQESQTEAEEGEKAYSDIMGAPDDLVAYAVYGTQGEWLYSCKLLRQNGIPYLQLVSITVNR